MGASLQSPWAAVADESDASWDIIDDDGDKICTVWNPWSHLGDRPDLVLASAPETETRARLIAGAPDLLAALREFEQAFGYDETGLADFEPVEPIEHVTAGALRKMRAAIAKAEGR